MITLSRNYAYKFRIPRFPGDFNQSEGTKRTTWFCLLPVHVVLFTSGPRGFVLLPIRKVLDLKSTGHSHEKSLVMIRIRTTIFISFTIQSRQMLITLIISSRVIKGKHIMITLSRNYVYKFRIPPFRWSSRELVVALKGGLH